jgi:hypothetical protein
LREQILNGLAGLRRVAAEDIIKRVILADDDDDVLNWRTRGPACSCASEPVDEATETIGAVPMTAEIFAAMSLCMWILLLLRGCCLSAVQDTAWKLMSS